MSKNLKQFKENPAPCENFDVECLTPDELQNRWDSMYEVFNSMASPSTDDRELQYVEHRRKFWEKFPLDVGVVEDHAYHRSTFSAEC
jgi:hypothetical protein